MFPIHFFYRAAQRFPSSVAVRSPDESLTYSELAEHVSALARGLLKLDRTYQGRVGVGGANSIAHLTAILATMASGKIWIPLNPRNGDLELVRQIEFTEPSVLLLDAALSARIGKQRASTVLLDRGHAEDASKRLSDLQDDYKGGTPPTFNGSLDDVQAIKFTGGTTGFPKGVMQTYRAWNTSTATQWREFGFDESDRFLVSAPLTHGASTYLLPILGSGGTLVFPAELKAGVLLDAIEHEAITTLFMPPTLIYALVHEAQVAPRDTRSIRRLIYGAAPMPPSKIKEAQQAFGDVIATTYGQTEAPQVITCLQPQELSEERNLASVGRPTMLTEVRIVDEHGASLPANEAGEVVVRSDLVMSGYWRAPTLTAEAIRDGWLHTGDIGFLDERGFLYLKDRARDVIITGGFNVYPSDVEEALNHHPAVFDCAVFGVPDDKWGEAVHAAVVLRQGAEVTEERLIRVVKSEIGSVKCPKFIHFVDALPKSSVEKTLKTELRKLVAAAHKIA